MGQTPSDGSDKEELTLTVDDRGRIMLPKAVRDRFWIEPTEELPATLVDSVLEINLKPSSKLEPATAGRENWENTTPTDAGDTLVGPLDQESARQ